MPYPTCNSVRSTTTPATLETRTSHCRSPLRMASTLCTGAPGQEGASGTPWAAWVDGCGEATLGHRGRAGTAWWAHLPAMGDSLVRAGRSSQGHWLYNPVQAAPTFQRAKGDSLAGSSPTRGVQVRGCWVFEHAGGARAITSSAGRQTGSRVAGNEDNGTWQGSLVTSRQNSPAC